MSIFITKYNVIPRFDFSVFLLVDVHQKTDCKCFLYQLISPGEEQEYCQYTACNSHE